MFLFPATLLITESSITDLKTREPPNLCWYLDRLRRYTFIIDHKVNNKMLKNYIIHLPASATPSSYTNHAGNTEMFHVSQNQLTTYRHIGSILGKPEVTLGMPGIPKPRGFVYKFMGKKYNTCMTGPFRNATWQKWWIYLIFLSQFIFEALNIVNTFRL